MSNSPSRRDALRIATLGAVAFSAGSYSRILGANGRTQMALIGCGGRGKNVMKGFVANDDVQFQAVCDIYADKIDEAQQIATGAKGYSKHEDVLALKDLDAVLVATPDHWHAGIVIEAANAGKDIYVEKPLTLKLEEGPEIVKAVRINDRVCQVGMQQRSGRHYLRAKDEYVDSGKLGKVTMVRTWWHGNGAHLRLAPDKLKTKPSNLDWSRYLGPVKWRDYDPQQYHNFRAYLDFGGGQITDLFTHWIDVAHMFLEQDDPVTAVATGGVFHYDDGRTAPDTINCHLQYRDDWVATFEATLAPGKRGAAVEFIGTKGRLYIDRGHFEYQSSERGSSPVEGKAEGDLTSNHIRNFLDCVKSRKRPNGDVWIGHRSAQASHLGNVAYLQKRQINFDPDREEILPL